MGPTDIFSSVWGPQIALKGIQSFRLSERGPQFALFYLGTLKLFYSYTVRVY